MTWFANPSVGALHTLLASYLSVHGVGKHTYADPTPEHFKKYVLAHVRTQGHMSLSHVAERRVERVFATAIDAMLDEEDAAHQTEQQANGKQAVQQRAEK